MRACAKFAFILLIEQWVSMQSHILFKQNQLISTVLITFNFVKFVN